MTAKNVFLEFIAFLFGVTISILAFYYFIVGNNIQAAIDLMKILAPIGIIFGIFSVTLLRKIKKHKKMKKRGEEPLYIISLDFMDTIKMDIIIYGTTFLTLLVPFLVKKTLDKTDVLQTCIVFIGMFYLVKHFLLKKKAQQGSDNDDE